MLDDFSKKDEFLARLIEVSKKFAERRNSGLPVQDTHFLILRNDYMVDKPTHSLKLVEYNTIAVSFSCL